MWLFAAVFIVIIMLFIFYQQNNDKKLDKTVKKINDELSDGNTSALSDIANDDIKELELIQKFNVEGRISKDDLK
jgi:preprotein translocase subunit SecG